MPSEPLFAELSDSDPKVIEAMKEARRTLPQFLDAVSKERFSQAVYLVKVPFIDRSNRRQQALLRTVETAANRREIPFISRAIAIRNHLL